MKALGVARRFDRTGRTCFRNSFVVLFSIAALVTRVFSPRAATGNYRGKEVRRDSARKRGVEPLGVFNGHYTTEGGRTGPFARLRTFRLRRAPPFPAPSRLPYAPGFAGGFPPTVPCLLFDLGAAAQRSIVSACRWGERPSVPCGFFAHVWRNGEKQAGFASFVVLGGRFASNGLNPRALCPIMSRCAFFLEGGLLPFGEEGGCWLCACGPHVERRKALIWNSSVLGRNLPPARSRARLRCLAPWLPAPTRRRIRSAMRAPPSTPPRRA